MWWQAVDRYACDYIHTCKRTYRGWPWITLVQHSHNWVQSVPQSGGRSITVATWTDRGPVCQTDDWKRLSLGAWFHQRHVVVPHCLSATWVAVYVIHVKQCNSLKLSVRITWWSQTYKMAKTLFRNPRLNCCALKVLFNDVSITLILLVIPRLESIVSCHINQSCHVLT